MGRYSFLFSFLLLSALCNSSQASAAQLNQTQANHLGKLFEILQSNLSVPSGHLNNSINTNRCNWTGVTCISHASSTVVSKLSFSDLGISSFNSSSLAAFFDHLCSLDTLQYLDLSSNGLRSLPDSFSNCTGLSGLKYLNLRNTELYSPIPDFSKFGHLEILDLSSNYLTDIDLNPLIRLESLKELVLSWNNFTAFKSSTPIPPSFFGVQTRPQFTRCIFLSPPDDIFKHGNLTLLDLSHNQLTGSIPEEFNNLTKLDLSYNNLTGELYADLLSAPTLESIDLTSNCLTGSIPVNLSRILYQIRLGGNQLNGTLPTSIGELSQLSYLELDGNNLSGEIPPEMGNLSNLVVIELQMNKISGRIPNQISNLVNLNTLNLSQNALSGEIPSQISDLQKLSNLNLQGNNLSGSIPTTISNMVSLIELQLGENKLNGTIPEMPSSLTTALNLSHNCFSGSIPSSSFSKSPQLEILDLSHNNFSGPLPDSLTTLQFLTLLDLSDNNLAGTLPTFHRWVNVIITGNALLSNSSQVSQSKRKMHPSLDIMLSFELGAFVGIFVGMFLGTYGFDKIQFDRSL
ncbi:uncharacterized protein LOC144546171 [Carex rostrata]